MRWPVLLFAARFRPVAMHSGLLEAKALVAFPREQGAGASVRPLTVTVTCLDYTGGDA